MQWERTGFYSFPFFLLKSLTKKITLGRRGKGKKMGRSVQEPPVPPQDGVPHLRGFTLLAHGPGPRPSLGLTRPQPRAALSAPASVEACASAATPTPEQPHTGHVTLGPRSTYLNPPCSSGSSPPRLLSTEALLRVAPAARPALAGIGACAQEPYCVTPTDRRHFRTVSGGVYVSLQICRDRNVQYF